MLCFEIEKNLHGENLEGKRDFRARVKKILPTNTASDANMHNDAIHNLCNETLPLSCGLLGVRDVRFLRSLGKELHPKRRPFGGWASRPSLRGPPECCRWSSTFSDFPSVTWRSQAWSQVDNGKNMQRCLQLLDGTFAQEDIPYAFYPGLKACKCANRTAKYIENDSFQIDGCQGTRS